MQVLDSSSLLLSLPDKRTFFSKYSPASQALEESFVDMLLLSDTQPVDNISSCVSEMKDLKLDVREQLECIEKIELPHGRLYFVNTINCQKGVHS